MNRRIATARNEVPFLPKPHIENAAAALLAECAETIGAITAPPVPIDDIVERHLKLAIEIKDMRTLFAIGDVHGAIWMNDKIVGVDASLDPAVNPRKRGRYHFTLAHEAGHWRLHRQFYLDDISQGQLFGDDLRKPAYVCRSSAKPPVEKQADMFAAELLMPRKFVFTAWNAWRGDSDVVAVSDLRSRGAAPTHVTDEDLMDEFCRPLAETFQVSAEAMRIRLNELELLLRTKTNMLF